MHPFGTAVAAGDIDAALALLAEDVVFRSPVVHTPYRGRDAVAPILHAVSKVFEDFRYTGEIGAPDAASHVLVFRTRVGDREIDGIDLLHTGADGLIDEHAWEFSWDERGLRLTHAARTFVLGVPAVFRDYLAGIYPA